MKAVQQTVTKYQAIDDTIFDTEKECLLHECWLRLKDKCGTYFSLSFWHTSQPDQTPRVPDKETRIFSTLKQAEYFIDKHKRHYAFSDIEELLFVHCITKSQVSLERQY